MIHNLNPYPRATGTFSRATASAEGSPEKGETPKQRVSFDSDRGTLPAKQSIRQGQRILFHITHTPRF